MSNAFAQVGTAPKQDKAVINPRATRYGLLPIWPAQTSSRDFYVWKIPSNSVFPFRPFIGEIGRDMNDRIMYTTERLPEDQITDMYALTPFFIELDPLAKLGDEMQAQRIAEVLANPTECSKYPFEVGKSCTTCWLKDILTDMDARISAVLADDPKLQRVARECAGILREGLSKAIDEARRELDVAVRDIDDPKSGKSMFYDHDYLNVYHTHSDRPQYRTSTSNSNVGSQIADALRDLTRRDEAPVVDYAKLIADAVSEATKDLREKLAAYEAKPAEDAPVADRKAEIVEKVEAAKKKNG
jgi:hypothetical protein